MENYTVLEEDEDEFFPDDEVEDEELPPEDEELELDELSKEFVKKLIDSTSVDGTTWIVRGGKHKESMQDLLDQHQVRLL